jgi:hypothetical protein
VLDLERRELVELDLRDIWRTGACLERVVQRCVLVLARARVFEGDEQFAPASTLADALALAVALALGEVVPLLPQAASRVIAAPAAKPVVIFFDNMSGELLRSVPRFISGWVLRPR